MCNPKGYSIPYAPVGGCNLAGGGLKPAKGKGSTTGTA